VRDRHGRPLRAAQSDDLGIELFRKRVDDAGAKAGLWFGKDAALSPHTVVATESLQSVPSTSNATVICPFVVPLLKACFMQLMTSSVTISPMLSASRQEALPPSPEHLQRDRAIVADH